MVVLKMKVTLHSNYQSRMPHLKGIGTVLSILPSGAYLVHFPESNTEPVILGEDQMSEVKGVPVTFPALTTPGGEEKVPKLKWTRINNQLYTTTIGKGAFDLTVQLSTSSNKEHNGKWGVVVGTRYYSRDSKKWYETPEKAMR